MALFDKQITGIIYCFIFFILQSWWAILWAPVQICQ